MICAVEPEPEPEPAQRAPTGWGDYLQDKLEHEEWQDSCMEEDLAQRTERDNVAGNGFEAEEEILAMAWRHECPGSDTSTSSDDDEVGENFYRRGVEAVAFDERAFGGRCDRGWRLTCRMSAPVAMWLICGHSADPLRPLLALRPLPAVCCASTLFIEAWAAIEEALAEEYCDVVAVAVSGVKPQIWNWLDGELLFDHCVVLENRRVVSALLQNQRWFQA